jgi:cellulose synthase/poly-beta-1,6-N-acetylglucosamine synthase-like glycosyltransferase
MNAAAVVFLACLLLILYFLGGYPLLLAVLSRRFARPIRRGPFRPSISIVIPVYNGERFIADKLNSVFALDYPRELMQVVVVSDGSTDRTDKIASSFPGVLLLRQERSGKPAALNRAFPEATGEILVLTDARQVLETNSVSRLLENFADPAVGVASGELKIRAGASRDEADIGLYWRFESWMRNSLSSLDSMFGATGPFYAIRRKLFVPIPPDNLLDDMFLPLSAFFKGYRLVVDCRAIAWDYPTSVDAEFQRKVRTLAGNYQILGAYPRLLGRNRMWLHFVSYKFGRLLLPWLLLAVGVSSFWLPDPLRIVVIASQAALYLVAALDGSIPQKSFLKRISSPARTFVVMMVAVVWALKVFFVPARSLWKVTYASNQRS